MTRTAWFCPSCQKHHGPHVDTCPGKMYIAYDLYKSPNNISPQACCCSSEKCRLEGCQSAARKQAAAAARAGDWLVGSPH